MDNAKKYDYLIVGAGLFGATFAREMTNAGKRCLVIEKRPHIAGNCYTEAVEGIQVHRYGPHVFHTDSPRIWDYVRNFAEFNTFTCRPRVSYKSRIYSFPINLLTLHQVWGVTSPAEAEAKLQQVQVRDADVSTMKGWLLAHVGQELYDIFYRGYTTKQWGRDPSLLPASIASRVPIRMTFDDNYFKDGFQGIPIGGYTLLVANMLNGIEVRTDTDFFSDRAELCRLAEKTVYSGPIDRLFNYSAGKLEYRSLRFEREVVEGDYQGVATVNYTDVDVPFTRIVEHKHFEPSLKTEVSVITREYPVASGTDVEPFYPVNDTANNDIYKRYVEMAKTEKIVIGGRLGTYKYYDMHQVIAQALSMSGRELCG